MNKVSPTSKKLNKKQQTFSSNNNNNKKMELALERGHKKATTKA